MQHKELQEILTSLEPTAEYRVDSFLADLPNGLDRTSWKPQAETKLTFQGDPVKKLQVIRGVALDYKTIPHPKIPHALITEKYYKISNTHLCLEISTTHTKTMCSLDNDIANQLHEYFLAMDGRYDDSCQRPNSGELNKELWETDYEEREDNQCASFYRHARPKIVEEFKGLLRAKSIKSVILIEYGCGYGNFLAKCVAACQELKVTVKTAIGTDIQGKCVTKAKEKHPHLDFRVADSLELFPILNDFVGKYRSPNTVVIALSMGATNRLVLRNMEQAHCIFENLFKLNVDFVFLSGVTSILCNNTLAKRTGFKLIHQKLYTVEESEVFQPKLFKLLAKQTLEEQLKSQKKLREIGRYPGDIVLSTTPNLLKRLTQPELYMTTVIKDQDSYYNYLTKLNEDLHAKLELKQTPELTQYVETVNQFQTQQAVYEKKVEEFVKTLNDTTDDDEYKKILQVFKEFNLDFHKKVDEFLQKLDDFYVNNIDPAAIYLLNIYRNGIPAVDNEFFEGSEYRFINLRVSHQNELNLYFALLQYQVISHDQFIQLIHYVMNCFLDNKPYNRELNKNLIKLGFELLRKAKLEMELPQQQQLDESLQRALPQSIAYPIRNLIIAYAFDFRDFSITPASPNEGHEQKPQTQASPQYRS